MGTERGEEEEEEEEGGRNKQARTNSTWVLDAEGTTRPVYCRHRPFWTACDYPQRSAFLWD